MNVMWIKSSTVQGSQPAWDDEALHMIMNGSLIGAVFGPRGYILFLHLSLSLSLKHSLHKKIIKISSARLWEIKVIWFRCWNCDCGCWKVAFQLLPLIFFRCFLIYVYLIWGCGGYKFYKLHVIFINKRWNK